MKDESRSRLAPEALGPTITVGEILVEIMATTQGNGFLEAQPLIGPYPSGAPAIFISQVARLGGAAGIISGVGRDDFGTLNLNRLNADGVDVSAVEISEDRPTGSAFVRYRLDGGRDFVFNIAHSAAGLLSLTPQAKALADRAGHLHVMGSAFSIPGAAQIIDYAIASVRARGGSVSLDPNVRKELLTEENAASHFHSVVGCADLLLPSGEELHIAANAETDDEAIISLHAAGISEVVVKRGRAGASYFGADGVRFDSAAFSVEEVDPTGAGDCFGAAYLTCRRFGMSPADALAYANAAGACNVMRQGPMEGVTGFTGLDVFMKTAARSAS